MYRIKNCKIKLIIFFIFLLFFNKSYSQGYSQTYDSASIKATYTFRMKPDSTNAVLAANDLFVFEIGPTFTKFYSYYKQVSDSILWEQYNMQRNLGGSSITADLRGTPVGSSSIIFRKISTNLFTVSNELGLYTYRYVDTVGEMKWVIKPDTTSFLGYSCTKATTRFRGRNYTAWFTSQIPISAGPYKFFGLPGLIVNISDDKENFEFKLASLEVLQEKRPISLQAKKFIMVTRKEYKRLANFMKNDIDGFAASQGMEFHTKSINGQTNPPPPTKIPYNPIELE